MTKLSFEEIDRILDEALKRVEAIEHKVKHGKYKIQRKKVKSQVLKGHTPRDIEREKICKNARKKAHTVISNSKRDISNETRKHTSNCNECLEIVNESATTLSGLYGLDFMEEAVGWGVDFTFFDKPQETPLLEGLDIGTTATGRKRKCKAIGIAEGVFAPIIDAEGERVFSRNHRLYESDHWDYQLDNMNFFNRVHSRRMLGMIGHEDKKITDEDLREGRVSHIVTDLEIREDEIHGKYLWGRLEILNTKAGRNLKEYYENDIPLFVSSRGGGKLMDVPGQNYKMVDKKRYYCECFDVVKEPGFLEAAPVYHNVNEEKTEEEILVSELCECLGIEENKLLEVLESYINNDENNVINEDKNMSKVNVNIDTKNDSAQEIINKLLKPVTEKMEAKLAAITDKLNALESDLNDESDAEATAADASVEAEPVKEEAKAEEIKEEEAAEEKAEDAIEEKKCGGDKEDLPACDKKQEDKKDKKEPVKESEESEPKAEVIEEKKDEKDKKEEADEKKDCKKEYCKECSEDAAEGATEAPEAEAPAEQAEVKAEEAPAEAEPANEEWAHQDPKETAPARADLPKAPLPNGGGPKDLGDGAWAKEDPKETAPAKSNIADGKNPAKTELENKVEAEVHAKEKKDAAAVNAGIQGGASVTAHESKPDPEADGEKEEVSEASVATAGDEEAPVAQDSAEFTQQVTDYKSLYEALKDEFEECTKEVDELLETIDTFGKRHKELVVESETTKIELDSVKEQLEVANKALNSYKLQEQFNITVEKANELLSSKDYETVVEELKAAEAQTIEEEAQAKAEAVSESLSETPTQAAPVSKRKAHSAFSATISESKDEEISESVETRKRRRAYSAF